ncbi:MAG: hypothetical protein RDV48_11060 [Candidatus Eremiobacteraeota bacterium]|nr:hypothetical protein [Candidatus Eremiobacteraeota bacterium]
MIRRHSEFITLMAAFLLVLCLAGSAAGAEKQQFKVDLNDTVVLQSTNGSRLQCYFFTPIGKERPLPVLIIVPPGGQEARTMFPYAQYFAGAGMGVFCFDPQGRGKSEGTEDYNGPCHQDDVTTVIKYLRSLQGEVDKRNIGIISFYDGTTMALGSLFKNPTLDVKYLIDLEGPGTRDDCTKMRCPVPKGVVLDDFFWKEREGIRYIERIFCRYLRLQCKTDHAMNEDKAYAIAMYNKALKGKSPWARCNFNGTYQEMDPSFQGKYQWLRSADKDTLNRFVQEMGQMEPLPESIK